MNASPSWRLPPASAPADLAGAWCAAEVSGNPGWLAALCVAAFLRRASQSQAKASEDNGATVPAKEELADSMTGDASRLAGGRTPAATSEATDVTSPGGENPAPDSDEERQPLVVRWTPRRDELLLNMLAMGMPYAQIAADLDLPRSALAGRVMRLKAKGVRIPGAGTPLHFSKPAKPATRKPYSPALSRANTGGCHEDVAAKPKPENLNRAAQPLTKPLTVESPPSSLIQQHRKNADEIIKILDVARLRHGNDFEIQLEALVRKTGIDAPSVRSAFSEIARRGRIEIQEPFRPGFGYRVSYKRGVAA